MALALAPPVAARAALIELPLALAVVHLWIELASNSVRLPLARAMRTAVQAPRREVEAPVAETGLQNLGAENGF